MTKLVELRIAYRRDITTDTPCPEPLCGAKAGEGCAGAFEPVVHQSRLRAWRMKPLANVRRP
jgi:hypothetical protein